MGFIPPGLHLMFLPFVAMYAPLYALVLIGPGKR